MPQTQPLPEAAHPARLPADERRRQIISVAIDLFSRKGFSGTTTKEIAAAAGVTEAIIFRHFATKEQLYTAILDYRIQDPGAQEWLNSIQDFMDRDDDEGLFREIAGKIVEVIRNDCKFERVMLYAALEGQALAAMYHQRFAIPIVDRLRDYVVRRQQAGALINFNPSAIIFAIAGMAQQYAFHIHMCSWKTADFGDEEAVETFTRILMNGIRTRK